MNNVPRQMLRRIIAKYGNDLCGDARRCKGLLKDLCGEYRREINVLTNAIEERVPLDLLAAGNSMPRELFITRLAKRLEDNLGLTTEASHWAVDSWALALGIITESEVEAKEKKLNNPAPPLSPTNSIQPIPQNPEIQTSSQNRQHQTTRRSSQQTQPKPQPPKIYPPIARAPVNVPMPVPQSTAQRSSSNVNVPQSLPQPNNPTTSLAPKRRFRKFFGCLFIFFLLIVTGIVLLFGVPYAIDVMRETQRSEPRRFPPQ
jgi:hypothetical protein